ncbi:MAG: patatin-like phospholipase family protein [Deltaproteobacteria bacterium]|nr:patatin-like phospholipase family protein [Deltaproteobacteria bacterium]
MPVSYATDLIPDFAISSYRSFVRKARQAAHQALYFLYHLGDWPGPATDQAVAEFRPFALTQVRGLVMALNEPATPAGPVTTKRDAAEVIGAWQKIRALIDVDDVSTVDARQLQTCVETFLYASRGTGWGLVNHWRNNIQRNLNRHATSILTVILVSAGLFLPEQIRSLLIYGNRWGAGIFPFALLGMGGTLLLGTLFGTLRIGRRPFWQPWPQAVEPETGIPRWPHCSRLRSLIALGLLAKVAAVVLVQSIAFFLFFCLPSGMRGSRTAALVVSVAAVILMLAHVVDRWDFMDDRPTRVMTILAVLTCGVLGWFCGRNVVVAFLFALAIVVVIVRNRPVRPGGAPLSPRWISWFFAGTYAVVGVWFLMGGRSNKENVWRAMPVPPGQPMTRVKALDWPYPHDGDAPVVVVAASGGGSRAAIYTALALQKMPNRVRAHIHAVSSVSGGSLATAAYLHQRRLHGHRAGHGRGDSTGDLTTAEWQSLVEAVSDDFLLPTLIGSVSPRVGRGEQLEREWQTFLGTDGIQALVADWHAAAAGRDPLPPFPLPLFNSCTLDGHALVISPLDANLFRDKASYVPAMMQRYPKKTLTNVFDRDGIYALEDLLGDINLPITSAVRASANFPFGFSLIALSVPAKNLHFSTQQDQAGGVDVKLTDGGVLSNSGMWSLYNLLMQDKDTVARLKRRGVLLILFEASKMPKTNDKIHDWLALHGEIKDKDAKSQRLHRTWFENLKREYGPLLEIVQVDLEPTEYFNVGTTWALDNESKRRLHQTFEGLGEVQLAQVSGCFDSVKKAASGVEAVDGPGAPATNPACDWRLALARPPVD